MATKDPYPEHTKLKAISHLSQAVADFLEWCGEEGINLGKYEPRHDEWFAITESRQDLLARHFGIDLVKLENEKRAMLDECRKLNEKEKAYAILAQASYPGR